MDQLFSLSAIVLKSKALILVQYKWWQLKHTSTAFKESLKGFLLSNFINLGFVSIVNVLAMLSGTTVKNGRRRRDTKIKDFFVMNWIRLLSIDFHVSKIGHSLQKVQKHADGCSEFNRYEIKYVPLSLSAFNLDICLVHISLWRRFCWELQHWSSSRPERLWMDNRSDLIFFFYFQRVTDSLDGVLVWRGQVHHLQCSSRLEVCRLRQLNIWKKKWRKSISKWIPVICLLKCEQLLGC